MRTIHKAAAAALIVMVLILLIHVMYTNIVAELKQREQEETQTTTTQNNRIVLVVNKTIEEWKKIYRDYIIYSDKMLRKHNAVGLDYNLSRLLQIIDNANSSVIVKKFTLFDDVVNEYIVLEVVIPKFVIELYQHDAPSYTTDPIIKEIANILKRYIKEYPSNYTEYRLAYLILQIASQIHYKWRLKAFNLLLEIVYDQGDCETKSELVINLAASSGLWSADLIARKCEANGFPTDHEYVAIAIDNSPPWLKGSFNFTWKDHVFYIADVAVSHDYPRFPIEPYPCSEVENIIAPYWEKTYFIGKPLW